MHMHSTSLNSSRCKPISARVGGAAPPASAEDRLQKSARVDPFSLQWFEFRNIQSVGELNIGTPLRHARRMIIQCAQHNKTESIQHSVLLLPHNVVLFASGARR